MKLSPKIGKWIRHIDTTHTCPTKSYTSSCFRKRTAPYGSHKVSLTHWTIRRASQSSSHPKIFPCSSWLLSPHFCLGLYP